MESPVAGGARGLVRGQLFNESGELIASAVQEGLIRQIDR
jgi:acyl-CoA thioesterase-2